MRIVGDVFASLSSLNVQQQGLFACLVVEKMLPNFAHFSFDNGENITLVKTILDDCFDFQVLRIDGAKINLSSLKEQVEALTPNLDYEEGAASYAFDFCVALNALLSFFEKYQLAEVEIILEQAIATVDMFVQEYYNIDPSDADLDDKILGTSYMANEINRQRILFESVKPIIIPTVQEVASLREANKLLPSMIDLEEIYPLGEDFN